MISSTNMAALYSANAANKWSAAATTASERISTTYRINRSSDDPSGMMMATTLSAELSSYSRTLDNIHSGIAAIQNVDASLTTIASYLTEMRTLAVTANYQSLVGANEKLMDYRETLSDNMILSLTSAYGNVMDADLAAETTNLATYQIRQEAAAAVLVQSNTITKEMVAYLLKGVTS